MSNDIIFTKMADDFGASVATLRTESMETLLRGIGVRLGDARRQLIRGAKSLAGNVNHLTASNYVGIEILTKGMTTTLHSKLAMPVGHSIKEYPVSKQLGKVLPEEYFRHLCVEAYRLAKEDENKVYTGEELQERFTMMLNHQLPADAKIGLSGTVFRPHTVYTHFSLKLTDLAE